MGKKTTSRGSAAPSYRKRPRRRRALWLVLGMLAALVLGVLIYAGDYYRADETAVACLAGTDSAVQVEAAGDRIVFRPENARAGLIFYPGGKVEFSAYAPLMEQLARRGVLCVLVRMPLNLAVLRPNAADAIPEAYPEITEWAVGGHSLGGAMAAAYAASHPQQTDALVLLAAYSTADLTASGVRVISLYGTEDGVLQRDKYEKYRPNLPADTTETVIEGGCHAGFGSYGPQKGDGTPAITAQEQQRLTADAVASWLAP